MLCRTTARSDAPECDAQMLARGARQFARIAKYRLNCSTASAIGPMELLHLLYQDNASLGGSARTSCQEVGQCNSFACRLQLFDSTWKALSHLECSGSEFDPRWTELRLVSRAHREAG